MGCCVWFTHLITLSPQSKSIPQKRPTGGAHTDNREHDDRLDSSAGLRYSLPCLHEPNTSNGALPSGGMDDQGFGHPGRHRPGNSFPGQAGRCAYAHSYRAAYCVQSRLSQCRSPSDPHATTARHSHPADCAGDSHRSADATPCTPITTDANGIVCAPDHGACSGAGARRATTHCRRADSDVSLCF